MSHDCYLFPPKSIIVWECKIENPTVEECRLCIRTHLDKGVIYGKVDTTRDKDTTGKL